MAFCEFSNEIVLSSSTMIDNLFLSDFLPNANGEYVKVYLYGLYKCSSSKANTLEDFSKALNMSAEDILSVFYYWQELGLVNVINIEPVQVKYLPIKNALQKMKKYNVDKYTGFNISAQELIGSKMLTPREFEVFYYIIENLHMEKDALLKIIEYCVKLKGENVAVNYIEKVAKNWAYDGVRNVEDVDNRLIEQETISGDVVLVLKAMGIKRQATIDEYQQYLTWTKDLDMHVDIIVHIAKKTKAKTFAKLHQEVMRCYSNRIVSIKEIDEYVESRSGMFDLAKTVVKNLGLWYDNLETVVDNYISPWVAMGFEIEAIEKLSEYAFKSNIRTLAGLNGNINQMFKLGLLTLISIDNYIDDIVKNDVVIANIIADLGIERNVIATDRTMYKTWIYDWETSQEVLDYAVELAKGKFSAMQYLNRLLSEYHNAGIKDVESAKKYKINIATSASPAVADKKSAVKREYSKKELDSLFNDISEIEI